MIIIGEKINGAIPSIKQAIEDHNEELIRERVAAQAAAGADYIDCAPSTAPEIEYDTMVWLIDLIQDVTDLPISIDSPNPLLLKRIIEEGRLKRPGMVNSVNEEGTKCETLFPLIAGTDWQQSARVVSGPAHPYAGCFPRRRGKNEIGRASCRERV